MKKKIAAPFIALIALCFLSYLVYAIFFNSVGTNADPTMAFFGVENESQYGLLMTVASIGGIVVTIILGLFGERINKINGLFFGLGLMGVASVLIGTMPLYIKPGSGFILMLVYFLIAGIGYITLDLLVNGVITDCVPDQKNSVLPFTHAFYGMGAMIAPLFVTALSTVEKPETFASPYLIAGIGAVIVALAIFIIGKKIRPKTPYADMTAIRARATANPAEVFKDIRSWLFLLAGLFYLFFQTGMTSWLPNYCADRFQVTATDAASVLSMYFLGALAMRFLSPVIYKIMKVSTFYMITLAVSCCVFAAILFLPVNLTWVRILIVVVGLMQGSSIPSLVILCSDTFPGRSASASSVIMLSIALGALICPTAMGAIINSSGFLAAMLAITACLPVSIILIIVINRISAARQHN
ncbi:MAG: MFS transporter [Parasporobacterium sp.]|nr:MFS transporter [Parasporobacterium sp.]